MLHPCGQTLHTPNVQFEIHQISLNTSGKLLAVAGAFQVAVIVLPRSGFTRLVPDTVDCKYAFYHIHNPLYLNLNYIVQISPSRTILPCFECRRARC
jgi:hypothetical protein